tara:strand:+ start:264 stop:608 length:345 start_codon:yes stop_codon:yes gene_type:complete
MTKTQEEIEKQVVADADKSEGTRVRDNRRVQKEWRKLRDEERAHPTEVEIHKNACTFADKQLTELIQDLSNDRAAHHFSEVFPHDYVRSVMTRLQIIRGDLSSREGTPGFGKLK